MGSGRGCCVPGCKSSTYRSKNVSFSPFPRDEIFRQSWIEAIENGTKDVIIDAKRPWSTPVRKIPLGSEHQSVCGYHFELNGKRKCRRSIPRYFYHKRKLISSLFDESFCEVANYVVIPEQHRELEMIETCASESNEISKTNMPIEHNYSLEENYNTLSKTISSQKKTIDSLVRVIDSFRRVEEENANLRREKLKLELKIKQTNTIVARMETEMLTLKENVLNLQKINQNLQDRIKSLQKDKCFSMRHVLNDKMMHFYTGFNSMEDFNDLFEYIEPDLPSLQYYRTSGSGYERKTERSSAGSPGRPLSLDYKNQLFLVLCRLKVGLLEEDLAYRFGISISTVSRLCITWFDLLDKRLSQLKIWPSRRLIDENMPEEFKKLYPSTRVIIDCTELFIQTPSDYTTQSDTWSSYKHHSTAKGLIGITPNGFVSFVSKLVPGRMSDLEITHRSEIVGLLEEGDSVMADRGFTIENLLKEKNIGLNIPPFLGDKSQLSLEEENRTRDIASVRIHVERVIRSVKKYHLLNMTFPNSMSAQLQKIWRICARLTNFCNEPLLDVRESKQDEGQSTTEQNEPLSDITVIENN